MASSEGFSVTEKLLLAALRLEQEGKHPFSAEDLVVSAWAMFPHAFGLAGYRDESGNLSYPDSNRVFAEIMGSKPIRKRGFLEKVGSKMYRLTEAGREHAHLLSGRKTTTGAKKASLGRPTEQELKRLFASKALEKSRNGRIGDLTFYDACAFWGISPRSSAIELEGRTANFNKVVESAKEITRDGGVSFEHGGSIFGTDELDALVKTHQELLTKFEAELRLIRDRKDERKA